MEVARALQHSLSTDSVLDAVVDAALTITGSQRGFLLLKVDDDLGIRVAMLEADHADPRAFSEEQIDNRIQAFIESFL